MIGRHRNGVMFVLRDAANGMSKFRDLISKVHSNKNLILNDKYPHTHPFFIAQLKVLCFREWCIQVREDGKLHSIVGAVGGLRHKREKKCYEAWMAVA